MNFRVGMLDMRLKNKIYSMALMCVLAVFSPIAHAGFPVFFSWGGEKIVKVMQLPNTPGYQLQTGEHIDIGYRFSQITIFFIPTWNYDGHWCGYIGSDKRYMDYDKATLDDAAKSASLIISNDSPIPFWDAYGGKLALSMIVLVFLIYQNSNVFKKSASGAPDPANTLKQNTNDSSMIGSAVDATIGDPLKAQKIQPVESEARKSTRLDFQDTTPNRNAITVSDNVLNQIFTKVANEISEKIIEPGLMARADVEANGDEATKMRIYTKYRVKQCMDAHI